MSHDHPARRVAVVYELDDPALAQGAYELVRAYGRAHGLSIPEHIDVVLKVTLSGHISDVMLDGFRAKFRDIVSASVELETLEPAPEERYIGLE